jgi:hypothetical protein
MDPDNASADRMSQSDIAMAVTSFFSDFVSLFTQRVIMIGNNDLLTNVVIDAATMIIHTILRVGFRQVTNAPQYPAN